MTSKVRHWKWVIVILGSYMAVLSPLWAGDRLVLSTYLAQIEANHPAMLQLRLAKQAAEQRRIQGTLLTETKAFGHVQAMSETKPNNFAAFIGDQTLSLGTQAGLNGLWADTGTQWRTGLQLSAVSLPGANAAQLPNNYTEGKLFVELTQPLWRDAWDTALTRTKKQINTASDVEIAQLSFGMKQLLVEAEIAYWRHAVLTQLVQQSMEAVSRAQAMLAWTQDRRSSALSQDSDVAQGKALLTLRDLELEQAKSDLYQAQRALAYWVSDPVSSEIPNDKALLAVPVPKQRVREDLVAQLAAAEIVSLNVQAATEAAKPNMALSGSLSLNQRENNIGSLVASTLSTRYPSIGVTLQIEIPLDPKSQQAYIDSQISAWESATTKTKTLSQQIQTQWDITLTTLKTSQRRLNKTKALEAAQYTKWQLESERHKRGRSTLSQVLIFEQDYANAQTLVLRTKLDLLTAMAQTKLFGEH